MNTYFEQIIERDLAGQDAFLVLIWHMPDTGAERALVDFRSQPNTLSG